MINTFIRAFLILNLLCFGIAGCTSSESSEETASSATEETGSEGDNADEKSSSDNEDSSSTEEASEGSGDGKTSGDVAEDEKTEDIGEEIASNSDETEEEDLSGIEDTEELDKQAQSDANSQEAKTEQPPPVPEDAQKPEPPPSDVAATSSPEPAPETVPEVPPAPVEVSPPPGNIPLKKIKTTPFRTNGILANTVYIGRPGDTVESISQKIFGTDKSADLLAVNSFLSRGVKVGDKIYYNSPKRPTDETQMLTYYEDIGATPQEYEAKEGENIRVISKKLLGYENAWKEIWATNLDVESKNELPAGTRLRYWGKEALASLNQMTPPAAEVVPPPAADMPPAPPVPKQPVDVATQEPPPPPTTAPALEAPPVPPAPVDVPVPSVNPSTNTASTEASPPPAPMPSEVPQPPPPPPPMAATRGKLPPSSEGGDFSLAGILESQDTMTIMIGVAVAAIGLLFVLAMIRKRRTRIDFGQTQV